MLKGADPTIQEILASTPNQKVSARVWRSPFGSSPSSPHRRRPASASGIRSPGTIPAASVISHVAAASAAEAEGDVLAATRLRDGGTVEGERRVLDYSGGSPGAFTKAAVREVKDKGSPPRQRLQRPVHHRSTGDHLLDMSELRRISQNADVRVNARSLGTVVHRMQQMLGALSRGSSTARWYVEEEEFDDDVDHGTKEDREYIELLIVQSKLLLNELSSNQSTIARLQQDEGRSQRLLQDLQAEMEVHRQMAVRIGGEVETRDTRVGELESHVSMVEGRLRQAEKLLDAAGPMSRRPPRTPISRVPHRRSFEAEVGSPPPDGVITLAFTDIQGSTRLWEKAGKAMRQALRIHNTVVREAIEHYQGYEVKTVGDAFMIAFRDAKYAVACSLSIQLELAAQDWSLELLEQPDCTQSEPQDQSRIPASPTTFKPVHSKFQDEPLRLASGEADPRQLREVSRYWNGIRVRIGLNLGKPISERDPCTGRMDYFGPMVNKSARVEAQALGGMVAATREVVDSVSQHREILAHPVVEMHDTVMLKGISEPVQIFRIVPRQLSGRAELWDEVMQERKKKEEAESRRQKRMKSRAVKRLERQLASPRRSSAGGSWQGLTELMKEEDEFEEDEEEEEEELDSLANTLGQPAAVRKPPQGMVTFVFARIAFVEDIKVQLIAASRRTSWEADPQPNPNAE
eukprot:Hpha_TRINITY_DN16830_c5_g1::TRINITY_DN16830_c5_g1_i1::g.153725::m.153725